MSQNMNLSMTPYTQAGAFVCSQYDVGRECQITLVDDSGNYTIPTGATITVMATKPSGLGFTETCTWTGSTVTFSTTDTMTNEFGRFPAELRITQGDTILGTTNFYFKVEKSPHPNDVIDDDVIIRQNLVTRVTTLEGQMATVQSDITDVKADIGDLADLETTDTSSLVAAINEAAQSGGGGGGGTSPSPYTSTPSALGVASAGSSAKYSRGDHVHPMPSASDVGALSSDTAYVSSVNGSTGAVTIPTATTSANGLMSATDKSHLDTVYADYSSALTALGVI